MKSSVLSIVTFALVQALTAVCAFGGIWDGKRISVSGDSYSAFGGLHGSIHYHYPGKTMVRNESQMWWAQVVQEFGGSIESNRSCAGSAISTQYGVCASMLNMARNGQLGNPDVILVLGGLNNDWVLKHSRMTFLSEVTKYFDVLDSEYGAAEKYVILCKIHEQIDYRWGLKPMYRQVLREESRKRGYKVIDLDGYYGNENEDFDTAETPHPTLQGMNKIARRIIDEIRNGPGGYRELYDCLVMDDQCYFITDYVPNLARTRVTVRARFSTDVRAKNVLFYAGGVHGWCGSDERPVACRAIRRLQLRQFDRWRCDERWPGLGRGAAVGRRDRYDVRRWQRTDDRRGRNPGTDDACERGRERTSCSFRRTGGTRVRVFGHGPEDNLQYPHYRGRCRRP